MITFSNTISTSVAWLNLNTVKHILFFVECESPRDKEHVEDCHVIFYNDGSIFLVSKLENEHLNGENHTNYPPYLLYQCSSFEVIRSQSLFRTISELIGDE